MTQTGNNWLLWTDIETTGLDHDADKILQIASVLTNIDLSVRFVFPETTIYHDDETLSKMDTWCKETHTRSGLVMKVRHSQTSLKDAEDTLLHFLNHHIAVNDVVYIAGNSVHFDKRFIDRHMPRLSARLRYRILDVSSLSLVFDNLFPYFKSLKPEKRYCHTAEADILESIDEYDFYKTYLTSNLRDSRDSPLTPETTTHTTKK
jgi:oligoribonuclease